MSEEKELQGAGFPEEEIDDLASFVDFADLEELSRASSQEAFGDLGDLGDLGLGDLDLDDMPMPDLEPGDVENSVPDLGMGDAEDGSVPDLGLGDLGDTPMPDAEPGDAAEEPMPDSEPEPTENVADLASGDMDASSGPASEDVNAALDEPKEEPEALEQIDSGEEAQERAAQPDTAAEEKQEEDTGKDSAGDSDSGLPADAEAETADDSIDAMLGGLLDDLDMNGSIEEPAAAVPSGTAPAKTKEDQGIDSSLFDIDLEEFAGQEEKPQNAAPAKADVLPAQEKEPGLLKKVFGNVVTDEIAEQERAAAQEEEANKEKRAEKAAQAKEAKAAKKEEQKAEKAAKKEEQKKRKEAIKAEKAAKKAEKKEEKRKKREEEEAAAELEVVGKLNKVGVSIIIVLTILFLAAEIAGTNVFGYISTKNKAMDYFERGQYTDAYKEAIGTDMENKDTEEYNKIKAVMKVQQSLNAYQAYERIRYYPEALDALLRGLKRYDANIDEGTELEVAQDMMSCRQQILSLLKDEFGLSESQAYSILALDQEKYQSRVVKLGVKKK